MCYNCTCPISHCAGFMWTYCDNNCKLLLTLFSFAFEWGTFHFNSIDCKGNRNYVKIYCNHNQDCVECWITESVFVCDIITWSYEENVLLPWIKETIQIPGFSWHDLTSYMMVVGCAWLWQWLLHRLEHQQAWSWSVSWRGSIDQNRSSHIPAKRMYGV